jgi:hypothetical protein
MRVKAKIKSKLESNKKFSIERKMKTTKTLIER